ncbi:MAG: cbb3-type cytochrome oxidase assembly protein CcoS [Gammaproteobacteria bacterium]
MSILWALIPLSFLLIGIALIGFFWAVDNDQMEELDHVSFEALDLNSQSAQTDP